METTKNVRVSYSIATPLFFIFLILKLTGIINWSWWWVTSPLWISFACGLVIFAFVSLMFYIADRIE